MKHTLKAFLAFAVIAIAGCDAALAQSTNYAQRLDCDIQQAGTGQLPEIEWLQGSTPLLEVRAMRNGKLVAADTGTTCRVQFAPSLTAASYAVASNYWPATNASSYWVQFGAIGTNTYATNGTLTNWVYLVFMDRASDGQTFWSGSGDLYIQRTTATGDGLTWISATNLPKVAWGNIWGDVTDNQSLVDYIAGGVTATNAVDAQARSTASVALATAQWASNTAAAASATGTAAYALAAAASATGTAAYALAAGKVGTSHTGNVSVIGRIGIGTNAVTAYPPTRTNAANLLHLVDGGIYLEDKPHLLGGGSATSQTAAIFLGYDAREFGRPALWLNSYDYESGGNTYDAASDIYFGKGASFTDASLRWGLSSRPTNQGWGHESDGQFIIYEHQGLGSSSVGGTRLSIYPDAGGIGGPIKLGTETRYPYPKPDTNATLVVNDWTKSPVVVIEGNTNAGAASFPRIRMLGGTNIVDLTWSNGVLYCSGPASFPMIAIGTNASISNWPSGGGDVSTWWQYAAEGDVDIQGNSLQNVDNLVGTNNAVYTTTVAKAASALQSVPWGKATTNNMTNVNWSALGGTDGGWTNLAFDGTGNAITGATADATTLTLQRGTIESGGGTTVLTNASAERGTIWLASTSTAPTISPTNYSWGYAPTVSNTLTISGKANTTNHATVRVRCHIPTGVTCSASGFAWPAGIVPPFIGELEFVSLPSSTNWACRIAERRVAGVPSAYDDATSVWWPSRTGTSADMLGRNNALFSTSNSIGARGWNYTNSGANVSYGTKRGRFDGLEPGAGAFSLGAWYYPSATQTAMILGRGFLTYGPKWNITCGTTSVYAEVGSSGTLIHAPAATTGAWNHILITYAPGVGATVYAGGLPVATNASVSFDANSLIFSENATPFSVGNYYTSGHAPGTSYTFSGFIDAPAYWSRALTAAEAAAIYAIGRTP